MRLNRRIEKLAKQSFMHRLTLGILVSLIMFGAVFTFATGITTAVNGIAKTYGVSTPPFPQPFWELLLSLSTAFIPIAICVWDNANSKTEDTAGEWAAIIPQIIQFLKTLKEDKSGRLLRGRYDPDPGRRRHKKGNPGHRKGRVPPQLRAWVYGSRRKRTHDPGYRRKGPQKRRYDPGRLARARGYAKRAGSKVEGFFNRWGFLTGLFTALGVGFYGAYDSLSKVTYPDDKGNKNWYERYWWLLQREVTHLWTTTGDWTPVSYLKYKFLGDDPSVPGGKLPSAWVYPFWISLGTWLGIAVVKLFGVGGKYSRILRPIQKMAGGAAVMSFIGALALPGTSPWASKTVNMQQTQPGMYQPVMTPMIENRVRN